MGLAEYAQTRTRAKIIDLDNYGIFTDMTTNELYTEVYNMMVNENNRFTEKYAALQENISKNTKPLVITEGKTDVLHLVKAKQVLDIQGCDVEFYEIGDEWGDSKLKVLLENLSKIRQTRKIIGIFDRDVKSIIDDIEKNNQAYKDYSNNVYAICIPIPTGREKYTNISIEFYYSDDEIKREKDEKRLYFDNEVAFQQSAANKQNRTLCKLTEVNLNEEFSKKIFDENIGSYDWLHSKAIFADLVANDDGFSHDFNFSKFTVIFDKIRQIINLSDKQTGISS
jgi:hypothetical protein